MKRASDPFCTALCYTGETASFFYSSHITPSHSHNTMQLIFDLKGEFYFKTEHTNWEKFTGVIIKENIVHQLNTNQSLQFIVYLDPGSATAMQFKNDFLKDKNFCSILTRFSPVEEFLLHQNLMKKGVKGTQSLIQLIFCRINEGNNPSLDKGRITEVLQLIKEAFPADLSIDRLASQVFISSSRLRMQFKQVLGIPLHQYIVRHKILSAITNIINGLSIQDAAYESGFNDASHLNKMMQKTFSINPSMFIRENSNFSVLRDDNSFDLKTKRALTM